MLNSCLNICLFEIKSVISHRFSETDNKIDSINNLIHNQNEEVQL